MFSVYCLPFRFFSSVLFRLHPVRGATPRGISRSRRGGPTHSKSRPPVNQPLSPAPALFGMFPRRSQETIISLNSALWGKPGTAAVSIWTAVKAQSQSQVFWRIFRIATRREISRFHRGKPTHSKSRLPASRLWLPAPVLFGMFRRSSQAAIIL